MAEKNIRLKTPLPGPASAKFLELKQQNIPKGISNLAPFLLAEGKGALLTDIDGNTFIDFSSGIGVTNVGHAHPEVVEALKAQVEKFTHSCFMVVMYESYIRLAERLNALAPGDFTKKTAFFNSGAEAVENAVKFARRYTRKTGIISLECAFHGRTLLAMTLTSKVKPYKFGFGPFAPEVYKMPAPYCYRCRFGLTHPECDLTCARFLEKFFTLECPAEQVAAMIIEPVMGEGGFIVPPDGYLQLIREVCDKHGILLILDEIQTGFGRTGRLFACEHSGVAPDLMPVAKSLAAGLPLSGVIGRAEVMDVPDPGEVGGTYGGNPLGCEAALKVLDIITAENLPARAEKIGRAVSTRFSEMKEKYRIIGDVRGLGAMMALELVKDRQSKEPAAAQTKEVIGECLRNGLVVLSAGVYSNVVRTLMPLVITAAELEEGLDVLERAVAKADAETG